MQALRHDSQHSRALFTLANSHSRTGESASALRLLEESQGWLTANGESRGDLALAYLLAGERAKGWECARGFMADPAIDAGARSTWITLLPFDCPDAASAPEFAQLKAQAAHAGG